MTLPDDFPASVFDRFIDSAERYPGNVFLRSPEIDSKPSPVAAYQYSYQEAAAAVSCIAAGYRELGVRQGCRVAVALDSRIEIYLHLLALNALGASIVPLNSAASDSELLYVVRHSDSMLIAAADEHLQRLRDLQSGLKIVGEDPGDADAGVIEPSGMRRESEAALLYTSGTTGSPKACKLSNEYFLALGAWYNSLGGICTLAPSDRLMTPLPPNHMNALATSFTAMMMCGGTLVQLDRFHPRSWWKSARREHATIIHCLGVMVAMLLTLPESEEDNFSDQIKFCFGPGSNPAHQGAFERRFGIPLIEAWAMTETGAGGMTIADREPRHVGERCIGRPTASMAYRIVDENGVKVTEGAAGELQVRHRGDDPRRYFFSGYYKDETATEAAWRGGWFHTGDVVRQGPDGNLFFVDRRKNVIRRSGENIAAVEVESILLQLEAVENCAVCAVPDEIRGDEVFAFVVSGQEGDELAAREIFDWALASLAYFKVPGYIAFVDQLPLTASQKLSRGKVKAMALEMLENDQAFDLRSLKKRQRYA